MLCVAVLCDDDERRMKSSAVKSLWAWFVNSASSSFKGGYHSPAPASFSIYIKTLPSFSSCSTPPLVVVQLNGGENSLLVYFFFFFPSFRFKKGEEEEAAHGQQQQQKKGPREKKGHIKAAALIVSIIFLYRRDVGNGESPGVTVLPFFFFLLSSSTGHISAAAGRPMQRRYVTRRLTAHTHNQWTP